MKKRKASVLRMAVLGVCAAVAGCNNKLLDPAQVGRFHPSPAVNVILDSLGVAEESPVAWENAEEPRPTDVVAQQGDYVLQSGDIVRVSIFELYAESQMVTNEYVVNETGRISIPDVGLVDAAGMTETQLEEHVRKVLAPNILKNPSVSVAMLSSQQRTFSVIGDGVDAPGRHVIPRYDFRLTDALAMARGPRQFNVSHVYISRSVKGKANAVASNRRTGVPGQDRGVAGAASLQNPSTQPWANPSIAAERALVGMVHPDPSSLRGQGQEVVSSVDFPKAYRLNSPPEMISPSSFAKLGGKGQSQDPGAYLARDAYASSAGPSNQDAGIEWVFQNGRWVPVPATGSGTARPQTDPQMNYPSLSPQRADGVNPVESYTRSNPYDLPTAQAQTGRLYAEADKGTGSGGIDWVFQGGRWVPVPAAGLRSAPTSQADPLTAFPSQTPQRTDGVNPVEGYPQQHTSDLPGARATGGNAYPPADGGTASSGIEWVFQDGKWVPVQRGPAAARQPNVQFGPSESIIPLDQGEQKAEGDMTWEEAIQARLIRVPTDKLLAGDPRYNVVIKPGDTIHVPVDIVGECCITGNVNRAGYINLTGRPMTLKMAIAAAGGLGPLAFPKRCEVVRRIGDKREEIVMVDLDRIASGEQPDFFIKPNDLINVGTHFTSRWRAVLRNAFRATYGMGFVYDRNFADADYGTGWPRLF